MATSSTPSEFIVLDEIGSGVMSVVYRARDTALGREVALKVLRSEFARESLFVTQFVYVARVVAGLLHPGIPPAHQLGQLPDGRPYLGMRLIRGRTVEDVLQTVNLLDRQRLELFAAVCQAIGYAHTHGVIHRDLTPAHVMIGAFGEVQVTGWGLAKVLQGERAGTLFTDIAGTPNADRLLTLHGGRFGTQAYMAPEQTTGAVDKLDRRTDVFGLGAILCALLTGRPPYVGGSVERIQQLATRAELGDCFARLDECGANPDLVALCKRCLSADPSDRPADGCVVAAALANL